MSRPMIATASVLFGLLGATEASAQTAASRCEIVFKGSKCPAQPNLRDITTAPDGTLVIIDNFETSDANQLRCLRRASEYSKWCNTRDVVTARFIVNNRVVGFEQFPK